jgi:hypothetical protein
MAGHAPQRLCPRQVELKRSPRCAEVTRARRRRRERLSTAFAMIDQMKLRIARHTDRLDEVVRFYRDRVGFPEIGGFKDHQGYDGVIMEIPGTGTQLEFTAGGGHHAADPHPESLLVLYLDNQREIDAIAERIAQAPVLPANPYWQRNAQAYADPEGCQVLLTLS